MLIYCINLFFRKRLIFSEKENSEKNCVHEVKKVLLENSNKCHVPEVENV